MEAYIYCIPIDEETVKIGSHGGTIAKLTSRYLTTTSSKYVTQGILYQVQYNTRRNIENVLHIYLKTHTTLWIEGEKYKSQAMQIFEDYFKTSQIKRITIETQSSKQILQQEIQELEEELEIQALLAKKKRLLQIKEQKTENQGRDDVTQFVVNFTLPPGEENRPRKQDIYEMYLKYARKLDTTNTFVKMKDSEFFKQMAMLGYKECRGLGKRNNIKCFKLKLDMEKLRPHL